MKTKIYIIIALMATIAMGCKKTDEFLTKNPLDRLTDDTYWTSEGNVRTFAFGFYTRYFPGYAASFDLTFGGYFSGETLNDDFAPTTPTILTRTVPDKADLVKEWNFTNIRKANLFIKRVQQVPMAQEAKNNWTGVGRFFRALEYADKVKKYGDFPYYNQELTENDTEALYRPRDPRELVMDSVLADFRYAAANVRVSDGATGAQGLIVNKYVVLAFMSRVFLFEGTWQKYQENNLTKAAEYLEASKWAANELITSGAFSIAPDYRKLFNSLDLAGNPEIIMYRSYVVGVLTHALNSYNNKEPQSGVSKDAVESYLDKNGLPIAHPSSVYKGDKSIANVMADRDPRLAFTLAPTVRLNGVVANFSSSGYATHKFLNEDIRDLTEGNSNLNPTDAPVIRYAEVLLNYAEAAAELGSLTQADLDKTINRIRKRAGVNLPDLTVSGTQTLVNGMSYDDPNRDPSVSSIIWEIRRERRVELMMEGFRNDDLKRWKKYEYLDTKANPDINRGAWIKKSDYPTTTAVIEGSAPEGYIIPAPKAESQRVFDNPRVYLSPLPQDQIKLYQDNGVTLTQNPGWE
jgi:hypothetical protein